MEIKINSSAVDKLLESIRNSKININIALQESAELLKEEVRASIAGERAEPRSVATGEFLSSPEVQSRDMEASVTSYTSQGQGLFMEYGTTKILPRMHFRNSLDRITPIIVEKIQDAVIIE